MANDLIPTIPNMIYEVRGYKVMLDSDLALLYGVLTKNLNKAVKRNIDKFPSTFMFQVTKEEFDALRFQFGTSKEEKGGRRYLPYVFTEHGVLMTGNILNSEKANAMSVRIVEVFIQLRDYVLAKSDTNKQIAELRQLLMLHIENTDNKFAGYDETISQIIAALNNLIEQPRETKKIGFNIGNEEL